MTTLAEARKSIQKRSLTQFIGLGHNTVFHNNKTWCDHAHFSITNNNTLTTIIITSRYHYPIL